MATKTRYDMSRCWCSPLPRVTGCDSDHSLSVGQDTVPGQEARQLYSTTSHFTPNLDVVVVMGVVVVEVVVVVVVIVVIVVIVVVLVVVVVVVFSVIMVVC